MTRKSALDFGGALLLKAEAKRLVAETYDLVGAAYTEAREAEPAASLKGFARRLPEGANLLDVGCGSGLPVARFLRLRGRE